MMIPIVLASDEKYIAPTYITILSALINKNEGTEYIFYLLCPNSISVDGRHILSSLAHQYETSINIVNMGNLFDNIEMKIDHITVPTYYRLCLPELLVKEKRCIYLDSDTIVNDDLTELYEIPMEGYFLGGVLSEGIHIDRIYARELCKRIGLKDVSTYINAGVLLMNLDEIRKANIVDQWLELTHKRFPAQDQDILNLSCYGKIKVIELKFNAMTKCNAIKDYNLTYESSVYSEKEIRDAVNSPIIIHFADRVKPWNDRKSLWAEYWWGMVDSVKDEFAYRYINCFIDRYEKLSTITKRKSLKQKFIRITQIVGVYSTLKSLDDFIHSKGNQR